MYIVVYLFTFNIIHHNNMRTHHDTTTKLTTTRTWNFSSNENRGYSAKNVVSVWTLGKLLVSVFWEFQKESWTPMLPCYLTCFCRSELVVFLTYCLINLELVMITKQSPLKVCHQTVHSCLIGSGSLKCYFCYLIVKDIIYHE